MTEALDRRLPQSPDAERAVLGAMLVSVRAYDRVKSIVSMASFASKPHQTIFEVIERLITVEGSTDIAILDLKEELFRIGQLAEVGGAAYVASLLDTIPDAANVERYAKIVKRKADLRSLITLGYDVSKRAADEDDPTDIAADMMEKLHLITPADATGALLPIETITPRLEQLYEAGGVEKGVSTGWRSVDDFYTVPRGAWTLITGIPGHGKSGLLDALTLNLARLHDWQIVMFSAENFPPESHVASLIEKYVSMPFNDGPTARMKMPDVHRGLAFIEKHYRFINPASEGMTLDRLLALASALVETRPIHALTIDPWNELHHERADWISETEYISGCLTKIRRWARRHDAHVFMVAHPQKMQKDRDTGKYNPPTPYDVSGSAHWRNKADYCLCVYRDITDGDEDPAVSLFIQKARRREIGRLGQVILHYDKVTSEYNDPAAPRRYRDIYE